MKLRNRTFRYVADQSTDSSSVQGKRGGAKGLRRSAAEVMAYRVVKKVVLIAVAIGVVGLMIGYAFVLLYDRTGRFSVSVDNTESTHAITLCEQPEFNVKSSRLTNDQQVRMTNICGENLPLNIDSVNGQHNGSNYLAYTFYCKNLGQVDTVYKYEMTFNNVTNHVDECVRVRLYVNGVYTDYAKTKSDGTGKEEHLCDKTFYSNYLVMRDETDVVKPGDSVRFTAVIWIEGDDPDCNDSIINGKIKFDMEIEAKPIEENENHVNNG